MELGVAVIGIDSISRLNFMRQMVKSYNFINKEMNGDVMQGFTKVGENTFPNVIPMLTGRSFITEHNNKFDVRELYIFNVTKLQHLIFYIIIKQSVINNNNSYNLSANNIYNNFFYLYVHCTYRTGRTYGRTLVKKVPRLYMPRTSQNLTCLTI